MTRFQRNKSPLGCCLRRCGVGISALLTTLLIGAGEVHAEDPPKVSKSGGSELRSTGSNCGLYCVFTALNLFEKQCDIQDLIKPKYVSSWQGSTLAELKQASEDHGLYAVASKNLTTNELRQSPHPVIVHVKSAPDRKPYSHYILFLGVRDGMAWVFDPPKPAAAIPFYQLAALWDGKGLIIADAPVNTGKVFAPARKRVALGVVICVVLLLTVHGCRRKWFGSVEMWGWRKVGVLSVVQAGVLVFACTGVAALYHSSNDEGLLTHSDVTAAIVKAHRSNFIPKVSFRKARRLQREKAVFIDARLERDFKAGHLESAISVPINSSDGARRKSTASITKDARVVVYCQSVQCQYAEYIAIKLISDGFSNISIYRGGWREWSEKSR